MNVGRNARVKIVERIKNCFYRKEGGRSGWKTYSKDLDRARSGSMAGTHVSVALGDGTSGLGVSVLSVHVVGARSGVVSDPDAEVLDETGGLLSDLLD